jgi:hypothetical protein
VSNLFIWQVSEINAEDLNCNHNWKIDRGRDRLAVEVEKGKTATSKEVTLVYQKRKMHVALACRNSRCRRQACIRVVERSPSAAVLVDLEFLNKR